MSKKERILLVLILFFLATLLLPWVKLINIFAVIFLCLYAFFFNSTGKGSISFLKEKWQLFRKRKYIQWMFLFFIMVIVSVCLSSNFHKGLRYLDSRLSLLYFPISIGLVELKKEFKEKILLGFSWLITVVVLVCLCYSIYRSEFFKKPEFLYSDSLTEILTHQAIYISLLVNFSIYIFSYNIFYKKHTKKIWMALATLFLFVISYLLASRNMMVVLYVTTIGFGCYYIFKQKRYLEGITLIMGLLIGVFLIFTFFPKTFNRYKELAYTHFNYQNMGKESHYNMEVTGDQWNGANFRIAAWKCGWEIFLSNPVKGVDIGDKKDVLMEKYKEKNFQFAINTQKNVHNNYLDILYSMGIIGLGLFLVSWVILPLLYVKRRADWLSSLIILTFVIAWITEIYFDRTLGGMLTGFFIPFVLVDPKP